MAPATWLYQGLRARLMYCFALLNAFSFKLRQYIGGGGKAINRTSGPNILKRSNRYVVAITLAIGLHALLFLTWAPTIEPIQLRLQSGHQSISLQLQQAAPSQAHQQESQATKLNSSKTKSTQEPLVAQSSVETSTQHDVQVSAQAVSPQTFNPQMVSADTNSPKATPVVAKVSQPTLKNKQAAQGINKQTVEKSAEIPQALAATSALERKSQIEKKAVVETITQVVDNSPIPVSEPSDTLPNEPSLESVAKPKGAFAIAQPLSDNNPKYPRRAIIRNQQGRVKVSFLVDKSGYVDNIELIESSGYALLDDSVFRFAEQERFVPATQDGIPIASNQSYLFRFVLQ